MSKRLYSVVFFVGVFLGLLVTFGPAEELEQNIPITQDEAIPEDIKYTSRLSCPPGTQLGTFKQTETGLQPLYTQFFDPAGCYCRVWHYFMKELEEFRGEGGSQAAKESLISMNDAIAKSSKGYFHRLSSSGIEGSGSLALENASFLMIDVGANIGQNDEFFSKLASPLSLDTYFFEPNPLNWDLLKQALVKNLKAHIVQLAVGDKAGKVYFDVPSGGNSLGNQQGHIFLEGTEDKTTAFKVDVIRLDDYFNTTEFTRRPVLMLKSDTEGYDVVVMKGAKNILSKTRFFIFECHILMNKQLARGPGTTHEEAQRLLSELGFEAFKLSRNQWVPFSGDFYHPVIDDPKYMGWQNCMAVHRSDPLLTALFKQHSIYDECRII